MATKPDHRLSQKTPCVSAGCLSLRVDTYFWKLAPQQNGNMEQQIQLKQIDANGIHFSYLECGSGPIALCVHGFPDSAHTRL